MTGNAPGNCEQYAFRQGLADNARAGGPDGKPDGGLHTSGHAAGQQKIGEIRASNQQHQSTDAQQNLQAAAVLIFHHGDAGARGNDVNTTPAHAKSFNPDVSI